MSDRLRRLLSKQLWPDHLNDGVGSLLVGALSAAMGVVSLTSTTRYTGALSAIVVGAALLVGGTGILLRRPWGYLTVGLLALALFVFFGYGVLTERRYIGGALTSAFFAYGSLSRARNLSRRPNTR